MPVILSIVGKSGSGKTTLIEKLVPELKRRGLRIGTIKHSAHKIDMDKPGKDSWRHKQAGADTVMVVAPQTIAMIKNLPSAKLGELEKYFDDVDLVLTEGFKSGPMPKIEVFRQAAHREPLCRGDALLIALITDATIDLGVPTFGLNDVNRLADLIEERCGAARQPSAGHRDPPRSSDNSG
ncbi:MAG: molybdopterin-guanine dinucleotide biosynthesis protein B [Deltaproteobacteria bacterium]|nr:molybdopterin-guanine dinucleotide biosynthesis protein B [Deltaproteobacteria bacterium]